MRPVGFAPGPWPVDPLGWGQRIQLIRNTDALFVASCSFDRPRRRDPLERKPTNDKTPIGKLGG